MKALYRYIKFSLTVILIFIFNMTATDVFAKTLAKKDRVRMKMYYFKEASGDRMLEITLTAGSGKSMHGVKEGEVILSAAQADSTVVMATVLTDTSGMVSLYFASDYIFPVNEEGVTVIEGNYEGNENYRSASKSVEIMPLNLNIEFEVVDSVKNLIITATTKDIEGNTVPVEELGISIGVQRLFSVLKIEEIETDDQGVAMLEFPNDIPGDAEGSITVVAKVDESDDFGTVVAKSTNNWGTLVSYELKPLPRQLYTDEAPIWMIGSVFIILLGAWYHFFLSVSKLVKMKKEENSAG